MKQNVKNALRRLVFTTAILVLTLSLAKLDLGPMNGDLDLGQTLRSVGILSIVIGLVVFMKATDPDSAPQA